NQDKGFFAVACLASELHIFLAFDEHAYTRTEHWLIIDHGDGSTRTATSHDLIPQVHLESMLGVPYRQNLKGKQHLKFQHSGSHSQAMLGLARGFHPACRRE